MVVELTTETTEPWICPYRNRARAADPSIQGFNDLRFNRALLEAGCDARLNQLRETLLDDLGRMAPCLHNAKE
jgi:hypothetical protein